MNAPAPVPPVTGTQSACRGCGAPLAHTFVDLGRQPLANDYLTTEQLHQPERVYPLHVFVCEKCLLVQLEEFEPPQSIFRSDYAYFSSFSETFLKHARDYVEMMMRRFGYGAKSQVIEIASNDGYLLQYFVQHGVPVLGIEPAVNAANVARQKGVESIHRFFGTQLATELAAAGTTADLLIGNNVLAHVPNVHDFVAGMKRVLKPSGVITVEFPHFLNLIRKNEFDTIYHEHFSYFSFLSVERIFAAEGLTLFDVEEIATHGGSLRIFARHTEATGHAVSPRVTDLRQKEEHAQLNNLDTYHAFWDRVEATKTKLVEMLTRLRAAGFKVAAYGAPAKGNTLFNYCQIGADLVEFTVDRNPFKQNHFLPGSHIPVYHPDHIRIARPDFVIILPWNLKEEIMTQIACVREWGGKFILPIPEPVIVD